ncbi:MAG: helix-turn-helix transcriptional regulator [Bdellovibrionales bacterium]|nr:helix-turn-helix transcriptional regulator [Bdellovibrionales bacterium]
MTTAKNQENLAAQFGENLFRVTRLQLALSTEDVAKAAEVEHGTVLKLESAPHLVSLSELYAVANCLNLDPGLVLEFLHYAGFHGGTE